MSPASNKSFLFIQQTDTLSLVLFVILLIMSITVWAIIAIKLAKHFRNKKHTQQFVDNFQKNPIQFLEKNTSQQALLIPEERLIASAFTAKNNHAQFISNKQPLEETLTRYLRQSLDEETVKAEHGMTLLATIAATAPFVGLFGTVCGVYHALVQIGQTGQSTIDKIAAPVGEALIMTALGLAVAIPAVVAFNLFTRMNRLSLGKLDGFAFQLVSVFPNLNTANERSNVQGK